MSHYVCRQCKNVAEAAGVCQTPDCPRFDEVLEECNCEDDKHEDVFSSSASSNDPEDWT